MARGRSASLANLIQSRSGGNYGLITPRSGLNFRDVSGEARQGSGGSGLAKTYVQAKVTSGIKSALSKPAGPEYGVEGGEIGPAELEPESVLERVIQSNPVTRTLSSGVRKAQEFSSSIDDAISKGLKSGVEAVKGAFTPSTTPTPTAPPSTPVPVTSAGPAAQATTAATGGAATTGAASSVAAGSTTVAAAGGVGGAAGAGGVGAAAGAAAKIPTALAFFI